MKFWLRWLVLWLFLGAGLRGWFLLSYPEAANRPEFLSFFYGTINDLQAFFLVAALAVVPGLFSKRILRLTTAIIVPISLIVFVAEIFFWLEFESRLDRLVFHYLAYPKEVLVFLQEQFYLTIVILPFALICWVILRLLDWPAFAEQTRGTAIAILFVGICVLLFGGPLGQSNSRVASEFSSNGYWGVLEALRYAEDDVPWMLQAPTQTRHKTKLVAPVPLLESLKSQLGAKRHVVLIIEESFAGAVWRQGELRRKYLPNFVALSKSSVSFTNMFATGSRTTRGMEALVNGFPPLPGISTTEREGYQHLPSLARGMRDGGFLPVFLYGGWPGFSNFTNYWRHAGFEKTWSREDFDEDFETSWGVSDGALFDRLLKEMKNLTAEHEQVFLATLTVSHHRPFTYPSGVIPFPAEERRSEYAMAYADNALGKFFARAKDEDWYADTLFILVADHGPYPRGDALIPVDSFRIPMLFHGKDITPRELSGLSSSMSLAKTLMSVFDIDTKEVFSGENLLCNCDTVVPVEYAYHVGLLEREQLLVMRRDGVPLEWYYDVERNELTSGKRKSPTADAMEAKLRQLFGDAFQWFYAGTNRAFNRDE